MIFHWIATIVVKIAFVYNSFWVSPAPQEPIIQPVPVATTTPEVRVEVVQSPVHEQPNLLTTTTEPSPVVPFTVVVYATTTSVQEVPQPVSNPESVPIPVVTEVPAPPKPCTLTARVGYTDENAVSHDDLLAWSPSVPGSRMEISNSFGGLTHYMIDGVDTHTSFTPSVFPTSETLANQSTTTHSSHQGYYHLIQPNGVECFAKTI